MDGDVRSLKWSELITRGGLTQGWSGPVDPTIETIVEDSRQVRPGSCFVAVRGTQADGHQFIEQAIRDGAAAIVSEHSCTVPQNFPVLTLPTTRGAAGRLASVLAGLDELQRAGRFKLVGITGTNGKSTFCYLLRSILQAAGHPTATLGTIEYDLIARRVEAAMTTPPPTTLMTYLGEAARAGATHAVMEVSSHALDQGRCDGLRFDVGVFSNLTGDHLDYHKTTEAYLRAKKKLFDQLSADAVAVINQDDPAGERMIADCRARVIRYGFDPSKCHVTAQVEEATAKGTRFNLVMAVDSIHPDVSMSESVELSLPLIGRHNVYNALAAASAAAAMGVKLEAIVKGLTTLACVPGRLQAVEPKSLQPPFTVLVDYAHTDDALENVLSALKPLTQGRLITLFGCGGDRDRTKRPRMAAVAARWSDHVIVTSDNPRTEDPERIIADVMDGFTKESREKVVAEPDRAAAISAAIHLAKPGDIVLLAGKGHETYQIIGERKIDFDDAAVAEASLLRRFGGTEGRTAGQS